VLLSHAQKRALIGNNILFVPAAIRFHNKCTTSKGRPERSEREKQGKYNRPQDECNRGKALLAQTPEMAFSLAQQPFGMA
jgi:hypothetical protein